MCCDFKSFLIVARPAPPRSESVNWPLFRGFVVVGNPSPEDVESNLVSRLSTRSQPLLAVASRGAGEGQTDGIPEVSSLGNPAEAARVWAQYTACRSARLNVRAES